MQPKVKYSKQRALLKAVLCADKNHPTADRLYERMREECPNISLGTVYRNLAFLERTGEIARLTTGGGKEHYDGDPRPHYHLHCTACGGVFDVDMPVNAMLELAAAAVTDADITGHTVLFSGTCKKCLKKA